MHTHTNTHTYCLHVLFCQWMKLGTFCPFIKTQAQSLTNTDWRTHTWAHRHTPTGAHTHTHTQHTHTHTLSLTHNHPNTHTHTLTELHFFYCLMLDVHCMWINCFDKRKNGVERERVRERERIENSPCQVLSINTQKSVDTLVSVSVKYVGVVFIE